MKLKSILIVILNTLLLWLIVEVTFFVKNKFTGTKSHIRFSPRQESRPFPAEIKQKLNEIVTQTPDRFEKLRSLIENKNCQSHIQTQLIKMDNNGDKWIHEKAICTDNQMPIYEMDVHQNIHSLRLPIDSDSQLKENFLAVVGCSFVYGQGLQQDETLPFHLQNYRPLDHVYNFGVGGGAPNLLLQEFTKNNQSAYQLIKESKGIFVYRYISAQIFRTVCPSMCFNPMNQWMLKLPQYKLVNNEAVNLGSFEVDRYWKNLWYRYVAQSPVLQSFGLQLPLSMSSEDYQLFVQLLNQLRGEFSKNHEIIRSLFVFDWSTDMEDIRGLSPLLKALNFEILDLSQYDLQTLSHQNDHLPGDPHPTSLNNRLMAYMISEELKR